MASKRPLQEDTTSTSTDQPQKKRKGFRVGPENLPDGAWRRKNTKIKEDLIHKAKLKKAYKKVKVEQEKEEAERAAARASAAAASAAATENNNKTEDGDDGEQQASRVHPDRQILLEGGSVPRRKREQQPRQNEDENHQHIPNGDDNDNNNEDNITQHPQQSDSHSEPQDQQNHNHNNNKRPRRPDYYSKALEQGARKKAEAEARLAEQQRRAAEREEKIAEREKVRKAMLKARGIKTGGGWAGDREGGRGHGHGAARRSYNNKQGPHKLGRESHVLLDKIKRMVGK